MTPERLFDEERRALSFGIVLSVSLIAFEAMSVATILPVAARELEGLGGYGWAFSAFMLANLVGTIATGQLADRRGPVRPLLLALAFFAAGLAVAGSATSWPLLIVGRVLQGAGGGGIMTLAYTSVRRGYPEHLRAKALAIVSTAWVLPSVLGPLAAGLIAQAAHWRWVFLGLLPLVVITGALMTPALARMPKTNGETTDGRRLLFAFALSVGMGLVLLGFEVRGVLAGLSIVCGFALALPALTKLLPRGFWTARPGLPAGLAFRGLLSFVFFGAEAFVPLGLSLLRGYSPTAGGLVLTAASLSWVVGSWTQAKLDERYGPRTRPARMLGGLLLVAFGIVGMAAAMVTLSVPSGLSTLGWAIAGLGMGMAYPTTSVLVLDQAAPGEEGWISSSLNLMENVGIALGAGFGGAVYGLARSAELEPSLGIALTFATVLAALPLGLLAASRVRTGAA